MKTSAVTRSAVGKNIYLRRQLDWVFSFFNLKSISKSNKETKKFAMM